MKFNYMQPYFSQLPKLVLVLMMGITSSQAIARCDDGQRDIATQMIEEARSGVDDVEKLILLKRSVKTCPEFVMWLELGKVELALDNSSDAVSAFENARDFHVPADDGSYDTYTIRRQSVSNGWLAEAYLGNSDLAAASVAAQEARNGFEALGRTVPERLVRLQATIDDQISSADAAVLTRSFEIQHERATRGIGVRPVINPEPESQDSAIESARLESEYAENNTSDNLSTATTALVETSASEKPTEVEEPSPVTLTESRLNIPVLFDYDSFDLSDASQKTVQQLGTAINALKLEKPATVIVVGHTDSQGSADYNKKLSLNRANTVLNAIKQLISSSPHYESIGLGEEQLRYNGISSDDHRRNRRVEVIIKR